MAIAGVAIAGLAIAGYLTYVHYAEIKPFCVAGAGNCQKVQRSEWADLLGIPVALLGVVGYLSILGTALLRGEAGRLGGAVLALAGFGFSMYLTYREAYSVEAFCQFCVASAVLMTVLAVLTVWRLVAAD